MEPRALHLQQHVGQCGALVHHEHAPQPAERDGRSGVGHPQQILDVHEAHDVIQAAPHDGEP
jgi:hypothetical protein